MLSMLEQSVLCWWNWFQWLRPCVNMTILASVSDCVSQFLYISTVQRSRRCMWYESILKRLRCLWFPGRQPIHSMLSFFQFETLLTQLTPSKRMKEGECLARFRSFVRCGGLEYLCMFSLTQIRSTVLQGLAPGRSWPPVPQHHCPLS